MHLILTMAKKSRIISALLCILLTVAAVPPTTRAEEATKSKSVKECLKEFPKFKAPEGDADFAPFSEPEEKLSSALRFRRAFENARHQYQKFVQCIFDGAAGEILDHPDITSLWVAESACIDPNTLVKTANSTSSKELLPPVMRAFNAYVAHLKYLHVRYDDELQMEGNAISQFSARVVSVHKMENLVIDELQNAKASISAALSKLTEMRQVFVMHVHFQCMVVNLRKYNQVLANLRSVVEVLPAHIIDASTVRK